MPPTPNSPTPNAAPGATAAELARARTFAALAPAPEDAALALVPARGAHFVDGAFTVGRGAEFPTINPATGDVLATFRNATATEVDAAVAAARRALPAWAALPPLERGKVLYRLSRRLAEWARALAVTESLDCGKPIRESRDVDVPLACQHLFHHAGWADKLAFAQLGTDPRPVGVCAQIIPWNFPLLMAAWKVAPALACGNTVVLKPAETTPLTAYALACAAAEVGLPPGVLNVVFGAGATGAALAAHPGVDKVAFTGSTGVGRHLARTLAGTGTRLTLELGGKGANVVFADADLDAAAEGVVQGIFYNQGHVCCAGSRLLVAESVHDELLARLADRVARIRVGDPLDKNTDLGAINSPAQHARITTLVERALADGAVPLDVACPLPDPARFFAPTVLTNVNAAMDIARTEVFGPVLSVLTFRTPDEAVALANDVPYGLAGGVWTSSVERANWTAARLRAGVVWVNSYNRFDPTAAFGGFAESGFGREGGRAGLEAYCA
jgi:aldehyde dehydrogenase (NAD+)